MILYSWFKGEIEDGIAVWDDPRNKNGPVIFLGEGGKGRRCQKVPLFKNCPAEVIGGRVYLAHPVRVETEKGRKRGHHYALARTLNQDQVLVRVSTQWTYTHATTGSWSTISGNPRTIVCGYGAQGVVGNSGEWDDGLVVMSHGDTLKIRPKGGFLVGEYALLYSESDGLLTMPFKEYEGVLVRHGGTLNFSSAGDLSVPGSVRGCVSVLTSPKGRNRIINPT